MLNILSYNIEYGNNLDQIINWLKDLKNRPDIICLQEFPQHKLSDLKISNYKNVFIPGWGRYDKVFGQLTIYRNDLLRLLNYQIVDLGLRTLEKKIFKMTGQRNALITIFKIPRGKIAIANIHLPWLGSNSIRRQKLELIMKELTDLSTPVIIIGDFNYSSLFNREGLVNFMEKNDYLVAGKFMITHKLKGLPQQLDYAFYKDCKIEEIRIDKVYYSDHYPIFLKIDT